MFLKRKGKVASHDLCGHGVASTPCSFWKICVWGSVCLCMCMFWCVSGQVLVFKWVCACHSTCGGQRTTRSVSPHRPPHEKNSLGCLLCVCQASRFMSFWRFSYSYLPFCHKSTGVTEVCYVTYLPVDSGDTSWRPHIYQPPHASFWVIIYTSWILFWAPAMPLTLSFETQHGLSFLPIHFP